MAREIEVKFRLTDADALRRRLAELHAACAGTEHEINWILDTAERRLLGSGCGLRVRVAQDAADPTCRRVTLTYKGPREADLSQRGIKSREEIETDVEDDGALMVVLARLGFRPVLCYEKRRETWRLGEAEIVLDELPHLGWFAEIEVVDAAALDALRDRLGLAAAMVAAETYPELTARFGVREPDGTRSLRFAAPGDA